MGFHQLAGAAYRALTARKDGPSLYDVCDPLLLNGHGGDAHLCKFYRTALGNAPLRSLLRGAGLPELSDPSRMSTLQNAIASARDQAEPDWEAVGRPVAELLDTIELAHPRPAPAPANGALPQLATIESTIRTAAAHLLGSYKKNGFIPTYAAST